MGLEKNQKLGVGSVGVWDLDLVLQPGFNTLI